METKSITVKKSEFVKILDKVRWTVSGSSLVPLLQSLCFKEDLVSGYNGQAGVVTGCPMNGMNFAVPATLFYSIIRNLFEEITISQTEKRINISSGGHNTWMGYMTTKGYPEIVPESSGKLTEAKNLVEGLRAIAFMVSTNVMRPELLGVVLKDKYLYASDGKRLGRYELDAPISQEVALPAEAISQLSRLGPPDYLFHCHAGAGAMYAATKTLYVTRTYPPKFPCSTVDQLLSRTEEGYITELPEDLSTVVSRSSIVANQQTTVEIVVENIPTENRLIVRSSTPGIGASEESVNWIFPHAFKFATSPEYLQQGLTCSRKVDLTDVASPQKTNRSIKFIQDKFEHSVGLMLLKEG